MCCQHWRLPDNGHDKPGSALLSGAGGLRLEILETDWPVLVERHLRTYLDRDEPGDVLIGMCRKK